MSVLLFGLSLLMSVVVALITIRLAVKHAVGGDENIGIQKFHDHWAPRLGGIPMFLAFATASLIAAWTTKLYVVETSYLLICILPAFGIGLIEDLTRKAGVSLRLLITVLAAGLGWWLLGAKLTKLDLPFIDQYLVYWPILALALTLFAVTGVAHAVNIIDGYNGLSSFHMLIALGSLALVSFRVGDPLIFRFSILACGAVLGFLVWNFPRGLIFMGDAGAYLLGFMFAELAVLLVVRNPEISSWCPLLLMVLPVWETLFSMVRRAKHGLSAMGQPDALHLHQLIYRRLVKLYGPSKTATIRLKRNSLTSVYYWTFSIACAIPAVLFATRPLLLMAISIGVIASYSWLYSRIIQFRTPRWMILKFDRATSAEQT